MRDWLYSKRPSKNIETKSKSRRKAEHKREGVNRQDERHWEAEGMKAMMKTHGREHRTRQGDTKGKCKATMASNLGGNKVKRSIVERPLRENNGETRTSGVHKQTPSVETR